ncbi:hypothetical protein B9K06_14315 [Bacillus sp. OG2]|nr:hypothetical protein B9K06_14315 [Bacillus sp. OG2]
MTGDPRIFWGAKGTGPLALYKLGQGTCTYEPKTLINIRAGQKHSIPAKEKIHFIYGVFI